MCAFEVEGLPLGHGGLSAAEWYTLVYGPEPAKPMYPYRLAVLELVARRVLDTAKVTKSGPMGKRATVLYPGPEATNNGVLRFVLRWLGECPESEYPDGTKGVEVEALSGLGSGFVQEVVMESLTKKGLFVREERSFLRLFSTSRWALTGLGWSAKTKLDADLRIGESQFGRWVDEQPSQAVAFIRQMGPAFLLLGPIFPDLRRLGEKPELAKGGDAGASWMTDSARGDPSIAGVVASRGLSLDALGLGGLDEEQLEDLGRRLQ